MTNRREGLANVTLKEAKELLKLSDTPPGLLLINKKPWQLECTYLTRQEALGSADYMDTYRLFKYPSGYALYERSYLLD